MQGGRSIWKSSPDNIDLNQSSSSVDDAMDVDPVGDNLLNPVERGFSSYASLSSGEGNPLSMDRANHSSRTLSGWDPGESSSGANLQGQLNASNDLKIGPSWSSMNDSALTDGRSVNWKYDRPDSFQYENSSNHTHRPLGTNSSLSSRSPFNTSYSGGYRGNSDDGWFSSRSHVDDFPFHSANSGNLESISGSSGYTVQHHDGLSPSSSSWGSSCKRKSLEGNSSQPCSSGNLNMDMDNGFLGRHDFLGRHNRSSGYNASSSLGNVSATSMNLQGSSHHGQLNPRSRENYGFHPSSVNDIAETSERNFSFRPDSGLHLHEPGSFDSSRPEVRNPGFNSAHHHSRFTSSSELPEMRAPSFSRPSPSHSHAMQASGSSRHLHRHGPVPFPPPPLFSGERSSVSREESSFRSSQHNPLEHSDFASPPEAVHTVQEPPFWNFSHGNTNSLRNVSSSTRISPSSSSYPFPPGWMPHQSPATTEPPRYGDLPPWSLFSSVEPEPRGQRGNFSFFPSASSSSEETVISSGSSAGDLNQPHQRSMRMDASSDDVNRWRGLASASRGRQRLTSEIHQVLAAMRRGEAFRAEDYVLFDPFTIGAAAAELHDRHRDMRLDVDNMSYEELLALEERIGDVKTGLSEDFIKRSMRQRKHRLFLLDSSNPEPCCICQDDYVTGDDVGVLDCGHEFHTHCITQWLTVKNLCPICKTTALES